MKKTIIALLALGGVAAAAPSIVWDMDFEKTGVAIDCAEGVATNLQTGVGTSLISNGAITLTADRFGFEQTSGQVSYAEEFTLVARVSLAATQASTQPVIFSLGEDGSWYWKAAYYTETDTFALDKAGWTTASDTYKSSGNIGYTDGEVITLALQNDGKGKVSLYVDGTLAGYSTISKPVDYGSDKLVKKFAVSGPIAGADDKASTTFYDMQLVKGLTTSIVAVPEPTTATLSLLALAGLAARRRRK